MKIIVRPVVDPQREIDLTHRLVSAIAEELWNLYGGNEELNWLEAERHLQRLIGEAREEADETTFGGPGQFAEEQGGVEEQRRWRGAAGASGRRAGQEPRRGSTKGVNAGHRLDAVGC